LGPDLGQCCGGRVKVLLETFDGQDLAAVEELARSEGEGEIQIAARLQEDGRIARSFPLLSAGEGGERSEPGEGPSARSTPVALSRPAAGGTLSRGGERVWRENYGERRTSLLLFGAGHVGRALVLSLAPLPFAVRWIDSREGAFPSHFPSYVEALRAPDPVGEVARAPTHAFVVVMTHDHPLDLAVAAAALERDFPFVGLIGSATKRARFEKRFRELGIPEERIRALACPIGLPDIRGKEPAVIAASATAQLLAERERLASGKASPPVRLARSGGRR
jgi:xanthine dehydrogenase accessory factor